MHVGLFTDCYFPTRNGVVSSVAQLKEGLEKRGHRATVFTVRHSGQHAVEGDVYRFRSICFRRDIDLRLGVPRYRDVLNVARNLELDLVHSHTEFTLGRVGSRIARELGLPHVHSCHTLFEEYRHYSALTRWMPRRIIRASLAGFLSSADAVICPSGKMRSWLDSFVQGHRFLQIANGADASRFYPRQDSDPKLAGLRAQLGICPSDKVILYLGRLGEEKRVITLLEKMSGLLNNQPHYKLVMVGGGPQKKRLQQIALSKGIERQLILTGFVEWQHTPHFYALADVFVSFSLSENCPMTLIEAAMCGLPIVALKDEAMAALVRSNENGILLENDQQMPNAVGEILARESRQSEMSSASIEIAQEFGIGKHCSRVSRLYRQLVGECSQAPAESVNETAKV